MAEGMENRITLITLGVADLARSIRFYEDGLKLPRHAFNSDTIAFFRLQANQMLALFPIDALADDTCQPRAADDRAFRGITLAHNVGSREEADAILEEARAAGARILKPGQEPPWGGWSGYFADPDNHVWEVAWQPNLPF
ncbi:VOC family protein [Myxococcus sp. Y35]|uniref:VOC family protein n=1 Tax=Pseudomyxococcus flavus TaxID=3115648 RepID=UPI003CF4D545